MSGDRERMLRTGFEIVVSRAYAADAINLARFLESARQHPPTIPLLMAQHAAILANDADARLRALHVPTFVIHATADQVLDDVNGDRVSSLVPGARLELLEDVGHLVFSHPPRR